MTALHEQHWNILVVDDEEQVHALTHIIFEDFFFEDRTLRIIDAYSAAEAKDLFEQEPDVAVILLDVVMETEHSGLDLVRWIRDEKQNHITRIILRTGQPGAAPELQVIKEYEINDYKAKTELTNTKLLTAMITAIRSYRDLKSIRRSKAGLEKIISATSHMFRNRSLVDFFDGVLTQIASLLLQEDDSVYLYADGFALSSDSGEFRVLSATGCYQNYRGQSLTSMCQTCDEELRIVLNRVMETKRSVYESNFFAGYFTSPEAGESILVMRTSERIKPGDKDIIELFAGNVAMAFENLALNRRIENSQQEIILTLGEVVESRSRETSNHVRRVSDIACFLAAKIGLGQKAIEALRFAAPLHDVGKIGIPDIILNKPGSLSPEEIVEIRTHTTLGNSILKGSGESLLELAAEIALTHHEHWDGRGYPNGLAGTAIPLEGRLVCVADVLDALSHTRIYKSAWSILDVFAYLEEHSGTQFDPEIVEKALIHKAEITALLMDNHDE